MMDIINEIHGLRMMKEGLRKEVIFSKNRDE